MLAVKLNHLALAVRDQQQCMVFLATYFGFDPSTARRYSDDVIIIRDAEGFALALGEAQDPEHTPGFPTSDSICTGLRRSRSWHDHSRPELGIGSVARRECFGQAGDRADSPGGSAEEGRATRRRQIQRSRGTFGRSSTTPYALKASPRGNGYRRPIARFPDIRRSAGSSLPHVPRSRI
jgi:hypothetical protein